MRKLRLVLYFLFIIFGLSTQTLALSNVRTRAQLRYTYQGQTYNVPANETFPAECSDDRCVVRANGLRLSVPVEHLEPIGEETGNTLEPWRPNENSSSFRGRETSEVGGGGSIGRSQRWPQSAFRHTPSASSTRLAQCYRERSEHYAGRGGVTSSIRRGRYNKPAGQSTGYCYRYVKLVLQDCGSTSGYLPGSMARDAGPHLLREGFTRWPSLDPNSAPVGAIIVYENLCRHTHPAGHIEIKTAPNQYASDYISSNPNSAGNRCRRVSGIYFK